jgi:hypothetical protein
MYMWVIPGDCACRRDCVYRCVCVCVCVCVRVSMDVYVSQ